MSDERVSIRMNSKNFYTLVMIDVQNLISRKKNFRDEIHISGK